MQWQRWLVSFVVSSLLAPGMLEGGDRATHLIRKGERRLRGLSTQALMKMTILRPSFTRELELRTWAQKEDALVTLLSPKKEKGVTSLRTQQSMWNYFPKIDRNVRVPTSMMLQPWMGSDFTNEDMMNSNSLERDYRHRILKELVFESTPALLIHCRPRSKAKVVWGAIKVWVRKKDALPLKKEYYDTWGRLVRTLTYSRFRKMDDRVVPTKLVVTMAKDPQQRTIVTYQRVLYDRAIQVSRFSRQNLKQNAQNNLRTDSGWQQRKIAKR